MSGEIPEPRTINIDIGEIQELVSLSIRRVSAFVRFGLDGLSERDGGDFSLTASVGYNFWPEEITKENRDSAREEYRAWLIGSCLRELDLFYGLFLDKIWFGIEVSELHGTHVQADHVFDPKFARKTNIAAKQLEVAAKLGIEAYYDELSSLSLARNSLSHNAGVVRSQSDCNNPSRDQLLIRWLAFDMLASRGGEERIVEELPFDTHTMPGEGPVQIGIRFTSRELGVSAGHPIRLSNSQIAELCMFYKIISDKIILGYQTLLGKLGILPPEVAEIECKTDLPNQT